MKPMEVKKMDRLDRANLDLEYIDSVLDFITALCISDGIEEIRPGSISVLTLEAQERARSLQHFLRGKDGV